MSGCIGIILRAHDVISFGSNAGNFGDMKYVRLFFTSSSHVAITTQDLSIKNEFFDKF